MSDIERTQEVFDLYKDDSWNEAAILALIEKGVDVTATDGEELTLLHCAAQNGHLDVCEALIKQEAKIDAQDCESNTTLHEAARDGHTEVVKLLLECGADIHAQNDGEDTPLHMAADWKKTETVKLLLRCGANVWAKNELGETVLGCDNTDLLESYHDKWVPKLEKMKGGDCSKIKTTEDLYHLASVMQPSNPHDIPHPKEFIRRLFQQYIPHEPKFAHLYEAIFAEPRPPAFDLQTARKEAAKGQGVIR